MVTRSLLAALLAVVAVSACNDEETGRAPAPPSEFIPIDPVVDVEAPLAAEDLCLMYAVSSASGGFLCQQANVLTGLAVDSTIAADVCRPGTGPRLWADRLLAAEAEGRVFIDWAMARECVEGSVDLRLHNTGIELAASGDWQALGDGACASFYRGLVKDGQACQDDWDCADPQRGCYTDEPAEPNSRACRLGAGDGQTCDSEYLPCRPGFFCNDEVVCEALHELDEPCVFGSDCRSGACSANVCVTPEPPLAMGEECEFAGQCGGADCVTCRPLAEHEDPVCALLGAQGDYCEDSADCVRDLGCTNNVCTTVGPFAECGTGAEVCHPNLDCVDTDGCLLLSGNQTRCDNDERCVFDDSSGYCFPLVGHCMALPVAGPCLEPVGYCAAGFVCDEDSDTCVPLRVAGETCVDYGGGYSNCLDGYRCAEGVCERICVSDADCTNDEVCRLDPNDSTLNACVPRATMECTLSSECGEGRYCLFPQDLCFYETTDAGCEAIGECDWQRTGVCSNTQDCGNVSLATCAATSGCQVENVPGCDAAVDCTVHNNENQCNGQTGCWWDGNDCFSDCAEFDGDATACAADPSCVYSGGLCNRSCTASTTQIACEMKPLCAWQTVDVVCDNTFDCEDVSAEGTCTGNAACAWTDTSVCDLAPDAVSRCADKQPTGAEVQGYCDVGQIIGIITGAGNSEACASNNCRIDDPTGPGVCTEPSNYGCYANDYVSEMISFTFLFGLVLVRRARRRRSISGS